MPLLLRANVRNLWHQKHEMCAHLKRNHLLSCSMWGQEGPRPAQAFSSFLRRGQTTPRPLWLLCCCGCSHQPPGPETLQVLVSAIDLHPCWNGFTLKDVTVLFQKECVSFFLGFFFLLNKFPCYLFVFSNCSSFKAPCLCSSLPLYRLFLETGEPGGGRKFRGVNCSGRRKLFPLVFSFFPTLSSHDLCGLTPLHCSFQGQP